MPSGIELPKGGLISNGSAPAGLPPTYYQLWIFADGSVLESYQVGAGGPKPTGSADVVTS